MIIALIFVLATVNIGNIGVQSTTLSNAADAGALILASNLATKSRQIWQALGDCGENPAWNCQGKTEKCKKKSFWSIILAVVIAIVAVVITIVTYGAGSPLLLMVVGAVAGAVGGMIGAAIDGTPILAGAITGAMIGAAIGGLAGGLAGLGAFGAQAQAAYNASVAASNRAGSSSCTEYRRLVSNSLSSPAYSEYRVLNFTRPS